jgi:hypothetical protein
MDVTRIAGARWARPAEPRRSAGSWLALVAALAIAACGGPPATPATTPDPAALPAGTYASRAFAPTVTFTVPDGWRNTSDGPTYFALYPVGNDVAGIHLFRDPRAASQAETCPTAAEPGVGGSSTELATWIRERPGLDVSAPRLVSVGGLRGVEVDVRIRDGWLLSCPFANGLPAVPLFTGADGALRWVVAGSERLRLSLLDVPGGGTVVVDIDAFVGSQWDALLEVARPVVATFSFATD